MKTQEKGEKENKLCGDSMVGGPGKQREGNNHWA